jgi:hypothetical protein
MVLAKNTWLKNHRMSPCGSGGLTIAEADKKIKTFLVTKGLGIIRHKPLGPPGDMQYVPFKAEYIACMKAYEIENEDKAEMERTEKAKKVTRATEDGHSVGDRNYREGQDVPKCRMNIRGDITGLCRAGKECAFRHML